MATKIQLRRDTASDWTSANPTLAAGEFGYESDTTRFKIGDGSTAWNSLAYKTGQGFNLVADDSATITVAEEGTLYVQGGTNVTTSTDSAGVLTINATGEVTASSTTTFTNKTFDVEGTGNSIANIDVADLKSGVLDTDLSSVSGSDDTLASAKAIKAYVDANSGGGASTGDIGFSGNSMSTSSSNADFEISANGTGMVQIAGNGTFASHGNGSRNVLNHKDHAATFGSKSYANRIESDYKIDSGQSDSSSSNDRFRNVLNMVLDLNGKDSTASNAFISRGPANYLTTEVTNSASGDSTLGNASGNNNSLFVHTSSTGDLTISLAASNQGAIESEANSGRTITFTDGRVFSSGSAAFRSGIDATPYLFHFKANAQSGFTVGNEYGFHSPDSMQSLIGGVTLQNGDLTTTGLQLQDNCIQTHRSNDTLYVKTSGTGQIQLTPNGGDFSNYSTNSRHANGNILYYQDLDDVIGDGNRAYKNMIVQDIKLRGSQSSSNSNDRWRNQMLLNLDMNGSNATATSTQYRSRGPMALEAFVNLRNTTTSNVTLGNASGGNYGVSIYPSTSANFTLTGGTGIGTYFEVGQNTGDVTVTDFVSFNSIGIDRYDDSGGSPGDLSVTNFYHFKANDSSIFGGGTKTISNVYGYYYEGDTTAAENYAFYSASDTAESRVGTLERYREKVNALTNSTTITVDCNLAPVHTVTIAQATGFNLKNLATGQTVTLIVKQDGTGSRTATFTEEDSTAILFPGGQPTLSTAASSVDVLTFFNTGSEVLGNCTKAYAAS